MESKTYSVSFKMQLNALLYFSLCVATVISYERQEYFWKDFNGTAPSNAILAGYNRQKVPLYIGKTSYNGKEIPGAITYECPGKCKNILSFVYKYNGLKATEKIKILCSNYPEKMEWIAVNAETFRFIWNKNIVMGGKHDSAHGPFPLLVGRKSYDDNIIIGGVTTSEYEMVLEAQDTTEVKHVNVKDGIELLSFNPLIPSSDNTLSVKPGSGYYWEDYEGFIPKNAIHGGAKGNGETTYIGQAYYNNSLVCGQLEQNTKSLYFVQDEVPRKTTLNIKILCAHHPEQMEWIDVTSLNYWYQWQKNIVVGGYYNTLYPFLVGRKAYEDQIIVGAGITHGWSAGLYMVHEGSAIYVTDSFQLLSYNPSIPIKDSIQNSLDSISSSKAININFICNK